MNILELTACAGYSAASYDDVPDSQKFENRWTSTTFYWLATEEAHYLIFRGSQQPRDFLVDAMALPVRYLGTWVHGGFALAHFSVRKKLRKILEDIEKSGKPLVVTGHSLGAAQGSLTLLMAHRFFDIDARGIFLVSRVCTRNLGGSCFLTSGFCRAFVGRTWLPAFPGTCSDVRASVSRTCFIWGMMEITI